MDRVVLPEIKWTPLFVRNPDRKWWQFWKPRRVPNPDVDWLDLASVSEIYAGVPVREVEELR